jgi:hypothetical protein
MWLTDGRPRGEKALQTNGLQGFECWRTGRPHYMNPKASISILAMSFFPFFINALSLFVV